MRKKRRSLSPLLLLLCLLCLLLLMLRRLNYKENVPVSLSHVLKQIEQLIHPDAAPGGSVISETEDTFTIPLNQLSDTEHIFSEAATNTIPTVDDCYAYYYQQLTADEQQLYQQIFSCVTTADESVSLATTDSELVHKIYHFILYDHPELFWCSGSSQCEIYMTKITFLPEYSLSADEIAQRKEEISANVKQCLSALPADASTYEKLLYVYSWLVDTVAYDENASDNQNIYSSLVGHTSVCAGYAKGFQYILNELAIPCIYLTGTLTDGGSHAWNMVQCNGTWYQTDVTFGDPVFTETEDQPKDTMSYAYLCCTDAQIKGSHIADAEASYPACNSMDLNYYDLQGWFVREADQGNLTDLIASAVLDGKDGFTLQCANSAVYRDVCDLLLDTVVPNVSQTYMEIHHLRKVHYKYTTDADMLLFSLYWVSE